MKLSDYFRRAAGRPETRAANGPSYSIGDPALSDFLGLTGSSAAGVPVTEKSSLGITAVYRSVSIIAGTIASLPLKSYRTLDDGSRVRVGSIFDDPGAPVGLTPFEWTEILMAHLLLHGNFYGLHLYNQAGAITGLQPLNPAAVHVKPDAGAPDGKVFVVTLTGGTQRTYTSVDLTHIKAMGTDGICGLSPIAVARNALGTAIAGDQAAARMFSNGMLLGGIVTSDDTLTEEQAEQVKSGLKAKLAGADKAGDIAIVNANLKFTPWTMPATDAQFIESRAMQVEEVARLYGVPREMLSANGASSWGSGISELVRGFQKFTLAPWTARVEQRLSTLLAKPRFVEFDFAGLLQPSTTEQTTNLIAEVTAGLLTVDEARQILNRPPIGANTNDSESTGGNA